MKKKKKQGIIECISSDDRQRITTTTTTKIEKKIHIDRFLEAVDNLERIYFNVYSPVNA
ncbi:unnamed protein product, partial [Musa acuminata subsp. burmannicoides]